MVQVYLTNAPIEIFLVNIEKITIYKIENITQYNSFMLNS